VNLSRHQLFADAALSPKRTVVEPRNTGVSRSTCRQTNLGLVGAGAREQLDERPERAADSLMPDVVLTTTHPVAQCVDLRATFTGRFRSEWDESYGVERAEFRTDEGPWLTVIPGRLGRIFPWGGRLLAAYTAARPARLALETLDGVTVRQGGTVGQHTSSEIIVAFDVSLIDAVAAILGSKRPRKRLTPDQRALLVERGRRFRFHGKEDGANEGFPRLDSTNSR